jgi:hypothetical protein
MLRAPAMKAGMAAKPLSFHEIFMAMEVLRFFGVVGVVVVFNRGTSDDRLHLAV